MCVFKSRSMWSIFKMFCTEPSCLSFEEQMVRYSTISNILFLESGRLEVIGGSFMSFVETGMLFTGLVNSDIFRSQNKTLVSDLDLYLFYFSFLIFRVEILIHLSIAVMKINCDKVSESNSVLPITDINAQRSLLCF